MSFLSKFQKAYRKKFPGYAWRVNVMGMSHAFYGFKKKSVCGRVLIENTGIPVEVERPCLFCKKFLDRQAELLDLVLKFPTRDSK